MNSEINTGAIMPQDVTDQIETLMAQAESLKRSHIVDKKAINKVIARLEEAWLWSKQVIKTDVLLDQQDLDKYMDNYAAAAGSSCICPPGVIDINCPIHGGD